MIDFLFYAMYLLLAIDLILFAVELIMGGVRRPSGDVQIITVPVLYRDYPHEEGILELSHGQQEVSVPTGQRPARVWISFEESEGVPCCIGQVDYLSVQTTQEGFIVIANVNSESVNVKWVADFA